MDSIERHVLFNRRFKYSDIRICVSQKYKLLLDHLGYSYKVGIYYTSHDYKELVCNETDIMIPAVYKPNVDNIDVFSNCLEYGIEYDNVSYSYCYYLGYFPFYFDEDEETQYTINDMKYVKVLMIDNY